MKTFQGVSPKVEVRGEVILSVVDGMKVFKSGALRILSKHNINNPCSGKWYPCQSWLTALQQISDTLGLKCLYNIGKSIPDNAQFPPGIDSIEQALELIDQAYHMNHRGGEIGSYKFKMLNKRSGKMLCQNPYPCDFDRGIITAMADKFKPSWSCGISVLHPPKARCRKKGDNGCIYMIIW